MKHGIAYERASRRLSRVEDREISLLFQRVNFFLVLMAFLITGFATLVVKNCGLSGKPLNLAYIIVATGEYSAVFFTFINYLNSRIIWQLGQHSLKLEEDFNERSRRVTFPIAEIHRIVQSTMKKGYCGILKQLVCELWLLCIDPYRASKKSIGNHSYLIPLGFAVFWVVVFFAVLPWDWKVAAVFLGLIPLFLLLCRIIKGLLYLVPLSSE